MLGRKLPASIPLKEVPFRHRRLSCVFNKTWLFYLEFNFKVFFCLLFNRQDAICAVDLDTALPVYFISKLKRIPRIYDARELWTEMKPVIDRPLIHKIWIRIEKYCLPRFRYGYAVSKSIAEELNRRYGVDYLTIRNLPVLREAVTSPTAEEPYILYQGYVHEARGIEELIKAMKEIDLKLIICGSGNLLDRCITLSKESGLEHKVIFKGLVPPNELLKYTEGAFIGINLVENSGLNQFYSLANKFFDYIQAELPQITMNFPEYKRVNEEYEIAILIDNICPEAITNSILTLIHNPDIYAKLKNNCKKARVEYNWQNEEKKLLDFYQKVMH
jgi:glycosyltransferase involved in cell wall biosynthesis